MLTDEQIQELIVVPKQIVGRSPAVDYREENGHRRCDLDMLDEDGYREFRVFVRQNVRFIRNFSIGLRYEAHEGNLTTITLARYNGPHGETSRSQDGHYALSHIHYITEVEIARGHVQPQEKERNPTTRYGIFEEALRAFFEDTSTSNYIDYFPELSQGRLFNGY